jgi:hypothetical protein
MRARFFTIAMIPALVGCGADWDLDQAGQELTLPPLQAKLTKLCSNTKRNEILAQATQNNSTVNVNCSLTLQPTDVVTKRLVFSGSGASGNTINCNGATIDHRKGGPGAINNNKDSILIKSVKTGGSCPNYTFARPTDITIKNCKIFGAVRVMGMAHNGQGRKSDGTHDVIKCSSRHSGHTARARAAAPTRITFDNLKITADTRTPFYLAPGVTYTRLVNSELDGTAVAAAVYLDAESANNTLRDNYIHTKRTAPWYKSPRELISVDGSSSNKIINNRFSALNDGGIYLYRNCGEGGVVRHARPYHNQIINNIFYYKKYSGTAPAVFLGSKEGFVNNTLNPHCNDDDGYPFGSSKDNADFVRYTVVMQNQLYKRPYGANPSLPHPPMYIYIRQSGGKNKPNYVDHNDIVTGDIQREAGCFVASGYLTNFILHGETIDVLRSQYGEPECRSYEFKCNDGELEVQTNASCSMTTVVRGCKVTGNNNGCQVNAHCPSGKRVIAARAACNLEWGSVSSSQLAQVPINRVRVVRASDNPTVGMCRVHQTTLSTGERTIKGLPAGSWLTLACREHDKNGGDCHVSARLYCQ